jgi:uncharacterized protein
MLLTFILLSAAICAAWLPPLPVRGRVLPIVAPIAVPIWTVLFAAAVVCGAATGVLSLSAVVAITLLAALTLLANTASGSTGKACTAIAAVCALVLSFHLKWLVFNNAAIFDGVRLTPDAVPFTQFASFNKATAGLMMLTLCVPGVRQPGWTRYLALVPVAALLTAAVAIGAADAVGFTRFEPKLPERAAFFLVVNLLFTVVAEEAFFRGVIQGRIMRLAQRLKRPALNAVAVAVSAALFGIAHAAGGALYVVFATLAGLGYAWVFQRTRSIEASIATHLIVNAIHFFFFAYPSLAP